jgi:predicted ATPase
MDESLAARIVEELPDEVGFYQFTHALMQETLIQELSHTRAVRMHALIAEALEAHYGDEVEEHAAELVEHFAEAETVLGTEKLVDFCVAAGNRAWEQSAYEESQKIFMIAYAYIDSIPVAETWPNLTFGRARAFWLEQKLTLQQV